MFDRWEVPENLRRAMVEIARQFRKQPTKGEKLLWEHLRARRLDGVKFRRQQPLGPFVVDFFAASHRLIVEIDGAVHDDQQEADRQRQGLLESLGLRFCRIRTELVESDITEALSRIRKALAVCAQPAQDHLNEVNLSYSCSFSPSPSLGEGAGG
jgi:very-short-patch-repair endonuclease